MIYYCNMLHIYNSSISDIIINGEKATSRFHKDQLNLCIDFSYIACIYMYTVSVFLRGMGTVPPPSLPLLKKTNKKSLISDETTE